MTPWFVTLALAQDAVVDPAIDALRAEIAVDALRAEVAAITAARDQAMAASGLKDGEIARLETLLTHGATLLDDRVSDEAREAAAKSLADDGSPRAIVLLRACAQGRHTWAQDLCAREALRTASPEGIGVAVIVLKDAESPKSARVDLVSALADVDSEEAAAALFDVGSDKAVTTRVRAEAIDALANRYPGYLQANGGRPSVVDPLGGLAFVGASGLAGGILLSSVGVWGKLDSGPALGAVGGSAIGLGGGAAFAATEPLTAGQGLGFASGVSFGLAYGAWATTATYGGWGTLTNDARQGAIDGGAAYRALGVLAGGAVGVFAVRADPDPWDVIEIDTATYLGSAVALGTTAVLGYRQPLPQYRTGTPPPRYGTQSTYGYPYSYYDFNDTPGGQYERKASQRHAASELVGATGGLAAGLALHQAWDLEPKDVFFGLVLGGQGALLGGFTPSLLKEDPSQLKGFIRLPWNAGIAGGLVLAEFIDIPAARTVSTAWGSAAGDALGAGLPLLAGYDQMADVANTLLPFGAAGAVGGLLAHPFVAPDGGDWTMMTVGTSIALGQGLLIGAALDDRRVFVDGSQVAGLGLTAAGGAGIALYGLAAAVAPDAADMLLLGSGAAWGAFYGGLVPIGFGNDGPAAVPLAAASVTSALGMGGTAAAIALGGLEPGDTWIAQLSALSGATLGALTVGLGSSDGSDAALGATIGATLGFGIGIAIEVASPDRGKHRSRRHSAGMLLLPYLGAAPTAAGSVPVAGVQGLRF